MSTAHEIADFIRLTRGISAWTLARAIRHRWPKACEAEIREAMKVASGFGEGVKSTAM